MNNLHPAEKYAHISFDDCVFWKDLIENEESYPSVFDNAFLSDLKEIHGQTDAVFTLNCFNACDGVRISDVPSKFRPEFSENKSWLKFSFHAEDSRTHYDTDRAEEIARSYDTFIAAMHRMTGTTECIDRVVRLGFFSGTQNNVRAIRDCDCGILGLLTADDDRISYYFDKQLNDYMSGHAKTFDAANHLTLIKSRTRLESVDDVEQWAENFNTVSYANMSDYLEFFTHECHWGAGMKSKVSALCSWCKNNGYVFGYMQDILGL